MDHSRFFKTRIIYQCHDDCDENDNYCGSPNPYMDDEDSLVCSYITSPNGDMRKEYIDPKFYRPRFIRMEIR